MKKNGKRYRKIQKEKELKRQIELVNIIDQEVDGIKTANLTMAQIVSFNPICWDSNETKREYLSRLKQYLKIGGWNRRKYESSAIEAYEKIIFSSDEIRDAKSIDFYNHYILFDLIHILGYETSTISSEKWNAVKTQYLCQFKNGTAESFKRVINSVQGDERRLSNLAKNEMFANEKQYIELIKKNIVFRKQKPLGLMVTATMSAGKSTFINAIVGKYICLSQNMACTSKIHSIINKAFEDGYSTEYDHDLVMTAGKEELLNDNEENTSDMIYVATNFCGALENTRVIVNDSPGVNFSGDSEHREIANRLIKRKSYGLLIYVMNSTQLGTNDEDEHLDFVKHTIGRTPIIFVMNKVDLFDPDEENVLDIINRQKDYLKKKGFKNPIVCPVSARAGYLTKQYEQANLSKSDERELYNYIDKFEKMNLDIYYENELRMEKIDDAENEETQLLKKCGLSYLEKMIAKYI